MPEGMRRRGVGLGLGIVATGVGAIAGLAVERLAVGRQMRVIDPTSVPGAVHSPATIVRTQDGVDLHVEVDQLPGARPGRGKASKTPTVIFSHGLALNLDAWHYQRTQLAGEYRMVFWDQRGHGRSGRGETSIAHLGRDLGQVIDAVAPSGPLVLIGHSMGGMSMMALIRERPDLLPRIAGVGLLSTSAGGLSSMDLGLPGLGQVLTRVAAPASRWLSKRPKLVASGRFLASDVEALIVRRYSFASPVPAYLVHSVSRMISGTDLGVLADFLPILSEHDEYASVSALVGCEALVMVGEEDLLTPPPHSLAITDRLPGATFVPVPAAGHLLPLEYPALVTGNCRDLIERSLRANKA